MIKALQGNLASTPTTLPPNTFPFRLPPFNPNESTPKPVPAITIPDIGGDIDSTRPQSPLTSKGERPLIENAKVLNSAKGIINLDSGSGVLIGKNDLGNGKIELLIVSNAHVTRDPKNVNITIDGNSYSGNAKNYVGTRVLNRNYGTDISLVRVLVPQATANKLEVVPIAKESPKLDDNVVMLGYPSDKERADGQLPTNGVSYSQGVVKQIGNTFSTSGYNIGTTSNLGQGASGGAILDGEGRLRGLSGQGTLWIMPPRNPFIETEEHPNGVPFNVIDKEIRNFHIDPSTIINFLEAEGVKL